MKDDQADLSLADLPRTKEPWPSDFDKQSDPQFLQRRDNAPVRKYVLQVRFFAHVLLSGVAISFKLRARRALRRHLQETFRARFCERLLKMVPS